MKVWILLAFIIFGLPAVAHAAAITFYDFAPSTSGESTQTGMYSFDAFGVGADWGTRYIQDFIWREDYSTKRTVYTSGSLTVTTDLPAAAPTAKTFTDQATMVADATHYIYSTYNSLLKEDIIKECFVDQNETITCIWGSKGGSSTTFSGPAMPIYTQVDTEDAVVPRGPPPPPNPPPEPTPIDPPVAPSPVDPPPEPTPIDPPVEPSPVNSPRIHTQVDPPETSTPIGPPTESSTDSPAPIDAPATSGSIGIRFSTVKTYPSYVLSCAVVLIGTFVFVA
ncbi:hypothetical protein BDZ94DRAFT_1310468 [Collybia nuda]|uniref:Uncharacterized protein n=1 Tax=Collybia nuda TaxID=64659 RepID=A0A9P5Y2N6_9AGAR|nr:hypothetical protein BDZ94DRAFT_1310468 [Collybia nuda]